MQRNFLMDRFKICKDYADIAKCSESYRHIFVVYDNNVAAIAEQIRTTLADKLISVKSIVATEKTKTIKTVAEICEWLLESGADRDALLIAVGGGITSDVAGFAASIYKRGIAFATVPTTLLSMADAAIGGKSGVNFKGYKNILGSIRQPEFIYVCPQALVSLPSEEFRSGVAELLKTFLIADSRKYEEAVKFFTIGNDFTADSAELADFIFAAAEIKSCIVAKDPCEKGLRRTLNFGHTIAHALEARGGNTLSHGEAVAIGVIAAARLSEVRGVCRKGLSGKLTIDFMLCGLPTELPCRPSLLAKAIAKDKKSQDGKINYVLISKPGKVCIEQLSVSEIINGLSPA